MPEGKSEIPAPLKSEDGHIWHERVFASMKIKCCMNCGFIKNEAKPNKPCPGPVGVSLRDTTPSSTEENLQHD